MNYFSKYTTPLFINQMMSIQIRFKGALVGKTGKTAVLSGLGKIELAGGSSTILSGIGVLSGLGMSAMLVGPLRFAMH